MLKKKKVSDFVKNHEECLKKRLGIDVQVFYGKEAEERMKKEVYFWAWWFRGRKANGCYNPFKKEVYIIKTNVSDSHIVGILAHELRHAYQYQKKHNKFKLITNNEEFRKLKDTFYSCRKAEYNANRYAYHYSKLNKFNEKVIKEYKRKADRIKKNREKHKNKHVCP